MQTDIFEFKNDVLYLSKMANLPPGTNFSTVGFRVTPIYTLAGRKKIYSLGDMSYGEFVIFQNDYPRYYLNCFDKQYEPFITKFAEQKISIDTFLEKNFRKLKSGLTMNSPVWGIRNENKSWSQILEVEKLPIAFLESI